MIARNPKEIRPRLIIGLGNPDEEYKNTYHNVGVIFVDYLSKALNGGSFNKAQNFEYKKLDSLVLIKSLTYMNNSGEAVRSAIKYFHADKSAKAKIEPEEILIIHDDSDLSLGKFKLSIGQGAAGHHGIESIVNTLGTNDFARIRIGIRPPLEKTRGKAGDFVLKTISPANKNILESVFQNIVNDAALI